MTNPIFSSRRSAVDSRNGIVATSQPLATAAGLEILAQGGYAPTEAAWSFAQVGYLRMVQARCKEALDSLDRGLRIADSNGLQVVLPEIMLWRHTVEFRLRMPARSAVVVGSLVGQKRK